VTTPAPPPAPWPAPPPEPETGGLLGRLRNWFTREVEPRVIAVEGDVENLKKLTPELSVLADAVVTLAEQADPAATPEIAAVVAGVKVAAAKIAEVVAALEAGGV
jgi:hypothetical protein